MNRFSIKRSCQVLRSELMFGGKELLIGLLASTVALALWQFINVRDLPYDITSRVLSHYTPLIMVISGLVFFVMIHKLLHDSKTLPFVSLPAKASEKLLVILFLGIIYFCIALLIIQINVWVEYLLYPDTNFFPDYFSNQQLLNEHTLLLNLATLWDIEFISFLLYIVGLLLFISVSIPKKIIAYPLFFIAPIGGVFLFVKLFNWLGWNQTDSLVNNESLIIVLGFIVGISAIIGAYFMLSKKEVKS